MTGFFTGKGDDGTTGILGDGRVSKSDPLMDVIGNVDELTASIGLSRANSNRKSTSDILLSVQRDLYAIMSELAASPENQPRFQKIGNEKVAWLETQIGSLEETIQSPDGFIVPGDSLAGAYLDVARTVCRRAERGVVGWANQGRISNQHLTRYLNRLSSLLFVLELVESKFSGVNFPTMVKVEGK